MFALLSSLDVHVRFGSLCQSRPKEVYYTLASTKFMENFATLNVALVAKWWASGLVKVSLWADVPGKYLPSLKVRTHRRLKLNLPECRFPVNQQVLECLLIFLQKVAYGD
jgi:hypothetical protein